MISKLLIESELVIILHQAGVLTSGRAKAMLNEHHIKHTRYAHQLSGLYMLNQSAYLEYYENIKGPKVSFDIWDLHSKMRLSSSPAQLKWTVIDDMFCPFSEGRGLQAICASM